MQSSDCVKVKHIIVFEIGIRFSFLIGRVTPCTSQAAGSVCRRHGSPAEKLFLIFGTGPGTASFLPFNPCASLALPIKIYICVFITGRSIFFFDIVYILSLI